MKELNNWLQWVFWVALGVFAVAFAFYLVSILIPVLLVVIFVSGIGNLLMLLYKTRKAAGQVNVRLQGRQNVRSRASKEKIIDVEYEIIDDK